MAKRREPTPQRRALIEWGMNLLKREYLAIENAVYGKPEWDEMVRRWDDLDHDRDTIKSAAISTVLYGTKHGDYTGIAEEYDLDPKKKRYVVSRTVDKCQEEVMRRFLRIMHGVINRSKNRDLAPLLPKIEKLARRLK